MAVQRRLTLCATASFIYEDPDYREEVVVRDAASGAVIERRPGALWRMPDGQMWILK